MKFACDITAANDGRVMVVDWDKGDSCVHIFGEHGHHLNKFELQGRTRCDYARITFHMLSDHAVIAGNKEEPVVEIFTKDGEFVRSTQIHDDTDEERIDFISRMTVTRNGRIALLLRYIDGKRKVLVI